LISPEDGGLLFRSTSIELLNHFALHHAVHIGWADDNVMAVLPSRYHRSRTTINDAQFVSFSHLSWWT
jgi:hypothetical protein